MATTSPNGIATPNSGDDYDLTADLGTMATTTQAAISLRGNYGAGTTAQRVAALSGFKDGALWWDTTTGSEWRRISGAWVNQDTGWVNLSSELDGGVSGTLYGRLVGKTVEIYGDITETISSGVTTNIATGVSATFRPTGQSRLGDAFSSAYAGNVIVRSDGTIGIAQRTGSSWSGALFNATFLKG